MTSSITALADRVRDDPQFLASALHLYGRSEGLDSEGVAAFLDCSVETLGPLALCLRPREHDFGGDVGRIAERFGLDAAALAAVVRRADALAALGRERRSEAGSLMAARDRQRDGSLHDAYSADLREEDEP
jgi:hypothetical protein